MSFVRFGPGGDPGPNFGELLRRAGLEPFAPPPDGVILPVPHATTCVAIRCAGGVVIAYATGRLVHDRRTGWLAAAIMATTLLWFALSRVILLDVQVMSSFIKCKHSKMWNY